MVQAGLYGLWFKLADLYVYTYNYVAIMNAPFYQRIFQIFNVYVKRASELYGITQTRPIYEKAVETLPETNAREMCLRFAELETKLGEIDRARGVYSHCSQMCDPRIFTEFWQIWKDFEIKHGNEDTVREMLRIKRSVQAIYNTQVCFIFGFLAGCFLLLSKVCSFRSQCLVVEWRVG